MSPRALTLSTKLTTHRRFRYAVGMPVVIGDTAYVVTNTFKQGRRMVALMLSSPTHDRQWSPLWVDQRPILDITHPAAWGFLARLVWRECRWAPAMGTSQAAIGVSRVLLARWERQAGGNAKPKRSADDGHPGCRCRELTREDDRGNCVTCGLPLIPF